MMKILKDVSKIHKKITSTRAPVAEPSLFISKKPKELTFLQPEHPSILVLFSQDFEEKPFDYPHQGPLLGTRRPMDVDLYPIFDEEYDHLDELDPIFDEKALTITLIIMENRLCFDPSTTPTPLFKEHCKELCIISSAPDLFDKKLAHGLILFFSNCAITCPDTILVYNTYFDRLHDDLKRVLHVLGKETLVFDLNKYLSCTYDPGILMFVLSVQDKHDQSPRSVRNRSRDRAYKFEIWRWKYLRKTTSKLQGSKMDLRSNPFQEGGNDVPLGSAPGKTDMHGLIMRRTKDICSLFDSYLPNHEASTHEITCRMF
uniref:Uncharacterized protein n=1 Tax=Brassica oleracea var. oleracea TaxID=109376 RepID=A0A0D3D242_BRAOL